MPYLPDTFSRKFLLQIFHTVSLERILLFGKIKSDETREFWWQVRGSGGGEMEGEL